MEIVTLCVVQKSIQAHAHDSEIGKSSKCGFDAILTALSAASDACGVSVSGADTSAETDCFSGKRSPASSFSSEDLSVISHAIAAADAADRIDLEALKALLSERSETFNPADKTLLMQLRSSLSGLLTHAYRLPPGSGKGNVHDGFAGRTPHGGTVDNTGMQLSAGWENSIKAVDNKIQQLIEKTALKTMHKVVPKPGRLVRLGQETATTMMPDNQCKEQRGVILPMPSQSAGPMAMHRNPPVPTADENSNAEAVQGRLHLVAGGKSDDKAFAVLQHSDMARVVGRIGNKAYNRAPGERKVHQRAAGMPGKGLTLIRGGRGHQPSRTATILEITKPGHTHGSNNQAPAVQGRMHGAQTIRTYKQGQSHAQRIAAGKTKPAPQKVWNDRADGGMKSQPQASGGNARVDQAQELYQHSRPGSRHPVAVAYSAGIMTQSSKTGTARVATGRIVKSGKGRSLTNTMQAGDSARSSLARSARDKRHAVIKQAGTQHAGTGSMHNKQAGNVAASGSKPAMQPQVSMQHLANKMTAAIRGQQSRISIQLKPPELGTVRVDLSVRQNRLQAVITAESNHVKQLLESHIDQLRGCLENQQLEVQKISVCLGQDSGQFASHLRDHRGRGRRSASEVVALRPDREGKNMDQDIPAAHRWIAGQGSIDMFV